VKTLRNSASLLVSLALLSQAFAVLRPLFPLKPAPPVGDELIVAGEDLVRGSVKPVGEPKRPRWRDAEEMPSIVPSATEVQEARELLRKYLRPTRLVRAESLERRSKGQVRLKIESDLPTGSFKPRGALFALLRNAERGALAGVVAASTGNHGAAVAYAARIVNLAATIFLPENPNPVKRARILGLGAKIVERGAADQLAAIEAARMFGREHGHYFLDDSSDSLVPAGAATIASEILDEVPRPDAIVAISATSRRPPSLAKSAALH
jgi:threonine synthase